MVMAKPLPVSYPPDPLDPHDAARVAHAQLRRRLLEGTWESDLETAIADEVEDATGTSWGRRDMSKMLAKDVWWQISVLYDGECSIGHRSSRHVEPMEVLLRRAGWFALMPAHQRLTEAQRETFLRAEVVDDPDRPGRKMITVQSVPCDLLSHVESHPDDPTRPTYIRWARERSHPVTGDCAWTWDVMDIRDPEAPSYTVRGQASTDDPEGPDLSSLYLATETNETGDFTGDKYPYRRDKGNGRPIIPGVMYHAAKTSKMFDSYFGVELVEAALRVAVFWTFWGHLIRDCSWPQRHGTDVLPAGGVEVDPRNPGIGRVQGDPSSILLFKTAGKNPSLGQWAASSSPKEVGESIRAYSADAVSGWGINPAAAQRVSADPQSGYAISLSRSAIRQLQDQRIPQFTSSDLEFFQVVAVLWNAMGDDTISLPIPDAQDVDGQEEGDEGATEETYEEEVPVIFPERGWSVTYQGLPFTAEEEKLEIERWDAQAKQGVTSPVDLYVRINGGTPEQARVKLRQIQKDRAEFAQGASGPVAPTSGPPKPGGPPKGRPGPSNEVPEDDEEQERIAA